MGTNFYFNCNDGREIHIGKMSAAGSYCTDCRMSLTDSAVSTFDKKTFYGTDAVHHGGALRLTCCPLCGKEVNTTTSSFTFAIRPSSLYIGLHQMGYMIKDEYGSVITKEDFIGILQQVGIRYYNSVGTNFS